MAGLVLTMVSSASAFAQEVSVRGGFLPDSMKIGDRAVYYLAASYPSDLTVLFPDSTHDFSPFEYLSKEYFLTETQDGVSADSAVYYLTTFEVDRVQYLSLPAYVAVDRDCTVVSALADSVLITQFVSSVPDTIATEQLPLKMNTSYQKVFYDFNVVLALVIVGALVAIALLVWIFFGKRIRRYFLMRRMRKNHANFLDTYNSFLSQVKTDFSPPVTESALFAWKRYMEQLESKPYTKLTTQEAQHLIREPILTDHLRNVDRAIYGHETTVLESLENLRTFADKKFHLKLKEVQHG